MDILAKRYGWSFVEIYGEMYWEEVYQMYEYASNLENIEANDRMKFDFMLHAQSKEAMNSWKDLPIPFPDKNWIPPRMTEKTRLPDILYKTNKVKREKGNPEVKKRAEEIKRRVNETLRKAREAEVAYLYGNYNKE